MNNTDALIKKYGIILDFIVLMFIPFLVIQPILEGSVLTAIPSSMVAQTVYGILLIIAAVKLFFVFSISDKKSVMAVVLLCRAIVFKQLGIVDVTYLVIPMVALYGVDFKSVAKVFSLSAAFSLFVILFSSLTGLIQNVSLTRQGSIRGYVYQLGFKHHNLFMIFWSFLLLAIIYIVQKNKYRIIYIDILLIVTVIAWLFSDSNTSAILDVIVCGIMIADYVIRAAIKRSTTLMRDIQRALIKFSVFMPIVAIFITILGCVYFGYFGYKYLPHNMLSRFYVIDSALESLGAKLPFSVTEERWDIPFNWFVGAGQTVVVKDNTIDNIYACLLIENGCIVLISYVLLQLKIRYMLYRNNQYVLALICSVISIFGILEPSAFSNFSCSLFSMLLFTKIPKAVRVRRKRAR